MFFLFVSFLGLLYSIMDLYIAWEMYYSDRSTTLCNRPRMQYNRSNKWTNRNEVRNWFHLLWNELCSDIIWSTTCNECMAGCHGRQMMGEHGLWEVELFAHLSRRDTGMRVEMWKTANSLSMCSHPRLWVFCLWSLWRTFPSHVDTTVQNWHCRDVQEPSCNTITCTTATLGVHLRMHLV